MKNLFFIFCTLLSVSILAAEPQESDFYADIEFVKPVVDVGAIPRDSRDLHVEFPFVNKGNAPLVLTYVHPSCNCVRVVWPRTPIAPGDSAVIKAEFLPSLVTEASFKRYISVKSNARKRSSALHIIGRFYD